jgi:hypothetical protein
MDDKERTAAARAARWQNHEPTQKVTARLPLSLVARIHARPEAVSDIIHEAVRAHLDALDEAEKKR